VVKGGLSKGEAGAIAWERVHAWPANLGVRTRRSGCEGGVQNPGRLRCLTMNWRRMSFIAGGISEAPARPTTSRVFR